MKVLSKSELIDSGLTNSQEAPANCAKELTKQDGKKAKKLKPPPTAKNSCQSVEAVNSNTTDVCPLSKEINIDVTERSHFRHKEYKEQK